MHGPHGRPVARALEQHPFTTAPSLGMHLNANVALAPTAYLRRTRVMSRSTCDGRAGDPENLIGKEIRSFKQRWLAEIVV